MTHQSADLPLSEEEILAIHRALATVAFGLPAICEISNCRRARACVGEGARCVFRHRRRYRRILPVLKDVLETRLAEITGQETAAGRRGPGQRRN